jgi:integrase
LQGWLAPYFERFVALKQTAGSSYLSQVSLLRKFDRYLIEQAPEAPLKRETLIAFLATLDRLSPRGCDNVVDVVWQALTFAQRHGARIDSLPPRPPRPAPGDRLREPRLVLDDEVRAIVAAARRLGPPHSSRAATYATLYGLLFVTGMRIGEALGLDIGDINLRGGLITICRGKFGKSRVLPVRDSTVMALRRLLNDPRRPSGRATTDAVFVSVRGRRLTHASALQTLRALSMTAGLSEPMPRPHDLRHSFAVLRVVEQYQYHHDVNALLPVLATYLGHVSVDNTRIYLRANGLLLHEACRRFALGTARLDKVLS